MHRVGLAAVLACACYDPAAVAPCSITCETPAECPGELTCQKGLCTDDVTTCGGVGDCLRDDFDTNLDPWVATAKSGNLRVDSIDGRLQWMAAPMTLALSELARSPVDLTGRELRIELVQAPNNGLGTTLLEFGIDTVAAEQFGIRVTDSNLVPIGGFAPAIPFDPAIRFLRIRHIPGDGIYLETSVDLVDWPILEGPITLSGSLAGVIPRLAFDGRPSNGAELFTTAAEVDNFEVVDSACTPSNTPPLVRDLVPSTASATELDGSKANPGGVWDQKLGHIEQSQGKFAFDPIGEALYINDIPGDDYDVELDVQHPNTSIGAVAVVGRFANGSFIYFRATPNGAPSVPVFELGEFDGSDMPYSACMPISQGLVGGFHRMRLRLRGDTVTAWWDGVPVCSHAGVSLLSGSPGIYFSGDAAWSADNFVVTGAD